MINKILKSTAAVFLSSVFTAILALLLVPVLLSSFGEEVYGLIVLTIFLSVRGGILGIFIFGVQSTVTKFVAEYNSTEQKHEVDQLLVTALLFFVLLSCLLIALLFIVKPWLFSQVFNIPDSLREEYMDSVNIAIISIIFQFINLVFFAYYEGLNKFTISKSIDSLGVVFYFISVLSITQMDLGFASVIRTLGLMHIFIFCLCIFFFLKLGLHKINIKPADSVYRVAWYRYSRAVFMGRIAGVLFNHTPKFFISTFLSPSALAIYDIASKIPSTIKTFNGLGYSVLLPTASSLLVEKGKQFNSLLFLVGFKINLMIFFPLTFCMMLMSGEILFLWVGETFKTHSTLTQVLFLVPLLMPFVSFGGSILKGVNHKVGLFSMLGWVTFLVGLVLPLLFFENYGLMSFAIGRVVGVSIIIPIALIVFVEYFELSKFSFVKDLLVLIALSLVPVICKYIMLFLIAPTTIFRVGLFCFVLYSVYCGVIFLGVLNNKERNYFYKLITQMFTLVMAKVTQK